MLRPKNQQIKPGLYVKNPVFGEKDRLHWIECGNLHLLLISNKLGVRKLQSMQLSSFTAITGIGCILQAYPVCNMTPVKLTQFSHGAGCGCKIAPAVLDN